MGSGRPLEKDEIIRLLSDYVKIDTSNPPGNELETARFLAKVLEAEGVHAEILPLAPGRANLLAKLEGRRNRELGERSAIALYHHMDVVPAVNEEWKYPPFSGEIHDGFLYGRGVLDMKAKAIADLVAFINIARSGIELERDIYLIATADEEVSSLGVRSFIKEKKDVVDRIELLIDEGGAVEKGPDGRIRAYKYTFGEKSQLWLTLEFHGKGGHGSVPVPDSVVNRLIQAGARLMAYEFPLKLMDELVILARHFLSSSPELFSRLETGLSPEEMNRETLEFMLAELVRVDPRERSEELRIFETLLRNTVAITGLQAGSSFNVIPEKSRMTLDCRLLPGESKEEFLQKIVELADDAGLKLIEESWLESTLSPLDSRFRKALLRVVSKRTPGVPVLGTILPGSTDSTYFRKCGVSAYGFEPFAIPADEYLLCHSANERISIDCFLEGVSFLTELLLELERS